MKRSIAWVSCLLALGALGASCSSQSEDGDAPSGNAGEAGRSAAPNDDDEDESPAPTDDGNDDDEEQPGDDGELPELSADTPLSEIPEACKGFEVLGLDHSPGGSVLPNTCAPFDGALNNPYAIRCIDADPDYATEWPGDEYCILPPPAELGTQVHVGPDSYTDPATYESFVMAAGQEINTYYYVNAPNTESHFYYRANWRMRDGSHHMIISMLDSDRADGWAGASEAGTDRGLGGRNFGGAQRTDVDRPQGTLDVPPENQGMGAELGVNQQFSFNLHHMNRFEQPILREAWVNIWYMDEAEVTRPLQGVSMFGSPTDLNIPPGEHRELHYSCDVPGNTRIVTLFGHRHANTDRFGIWVERASGEEIEAYESFDYEDMPTYAYDSVNSNPVPNVATQTDGGYSGILEVAPGDKVHFVCDITNRQEVQLRFANELLTGEMCIVFGSITGDPLCRAGMRVLE